MNPKFLIIAALVCMAAVPAFGTFGIVIGGTTLSAAGTTLLAAGLLSAKAIGIGVGYGLASRRVTIS